MSGWNRNVALAKNPPPEAGEVWTWTAICADTEIIPTWRIGDRTSATGLDFMDDLRRRLRNCVQLTTDGHRPYLWRCGKRSAVTWTTRCW